MGKLKKEILFDLVGAVLFFIQWIVKGTVLALVFSIVLILALIYSIIKYNCTGTKESVSVALESKDREMQLANTLEKLKKETFLNFLSATLLFIQWIISENTMFFVLLILFTIMVICNIIEDYHAR